LCSFSSIIDHSHSGYSSSAFATGSEPSLRMPMPLKTVPGGHEETTVEAHQQNIPEVMIAEYAILSSDSLLWILTTTHPVS
jgi:hypothetical protein